jgi:hypothetical protein
MPCLQGFSQENLSVMHKSPGPSPRLHERDGASRLGDARDGPADPTRACPSPAEAIAAQPGGEFRGMAMEQALLPHLNAAHKLARWLTGDAVDAEDVVQEAYLRALRFFGGFHGADARPWLLAIVRNASYTWLQQKRVQRSVRGFDEEFDGCDAEAMSPEQQLLREEDRQ